LIDADGIPVQTATAATAANANANATAPSAAAAPQTAAVCRLARANLQKPAK